MYTQHMHVKIHCNAIYNGLNAEIARIAMEKDEEHVISMKMEPCLFGKIC